MVIMKNGFFSGSRGIALVLLGLLVGVSRVVAAPLPNIVHIMVDDLGWQDIASHKVHGEPVYDTPHLDALTRNGRRFTQAYSPAPTCAPSRTACLRGKYPARTGIYHVDGGRMPRPYNTSMSYIPPFYPYGLSVEEPTYAEVLKEAGYVTCHVGKWHAGGKSAGYPFPVHQGFDYGFNEEKKRGTPKFFNDEELWKPGDRKNNWFGSWSRMKPDRLSDFATADPDDPYQLDEDGRPFDKTLDLAVGFMRKNHDRPFLLNFWPFYVHGPIQTRDRERFSKYLDKMGYEFPSDPGEINVGRKGHTNPYYASMVDTVDWMVGEVVAYLESTDDPRNPGHKLIDNTYIIVDSDNGGWVGSNDMPITDNSPLYGGKMTTFEGGIRIPFIVRGPGVPAGTTCDTPINLIDLFPTFMAISGQEHREDLDLDGGNILPLIQGASDKVILPNGEERGSIFWYYPCESHMSAAIRKGDYKLIRNYGIGMGTKEGLQLFRITNEDGSVGDLGEKEDLSEKEPALRDALLAELEAFLEASGTSMPFRNYGVAAPELQAASPAVTSLGSENDRVWAEFETGEGKAAITEGLFLYTLTPKLLDSTGGHREEWFAVPAVIGQGRVEANMPPGATHGAFCLRDANDILVTSEPFPAYSEKGREFNDSVLLQNGYAYKPGLYALIQLGQKAQKSAEQDGQDVTGLKQALNDAKQVLRDEEATEEMNCDAIRSLRGAIRDQAGAPEANDYYVNRFPTDPLF